MAHVRLVAGGDSPIDDVVELAGVPCKGDLVLAEGPKGVSELRGVGSRTWLVRRTAKSGLKDAGVVVRLGGVRPQTVIPPVATAEDDVVPNAEPEVAVADESEVVDETE